PPPSPPPSLPSFPPLPLPPPPAWSPCWAAMVTVIIVFGGRVLAGCTDSTVPGGCADVGTHARRGRRPSRRSSASITPACWPVSRALLIRPIGGDGGVELRGVAAPVRPACHPARPAAISAAATASAATAGFHPRPRCFAALPKSGSPVCVAWALVPVNVGGGAAAEPRCAVAG